MNDQSRIQSALKSDARWVVFAALSSLPRSHASNRELQVMTGLSLNTIKRARRCLKEIGLIDFDAHEGGAAKTVYRLAPIHQPEIIARVLARLGAQRGAMVDRGHNEPGHGDRGHDGPPCHSSVDSGRNGIGDFGAAKATFENSLKPVQNLVDHDANVPPLHSHSIPSSVEGEGLANAPWQRCHGQPAGEDEAASPISDDEAEWYLSTLEEIEDIEAPQFRLLTIDPGTRAVGWALFGPGVTLLGSHAEPVGGVDAKARIIEAGQVVARLIAAHQPTAILLEAPDYSKPCSDPERLQTFAAGVKQIEAAIAATGLPLHRLAASRHKDRDIKIINRLMFEERFGRAASEDEADAARLGWDFLQQPWQGCHGPLESHHGRSAMVP